MKVSEDSLKAFDRKTDFSLLIGLQSLFIYHNYNYIIIYNYKYKLSTI